MTVEECQRRTSSREFARWMVIDAVEGIGSRKLDRALAFVGMAICRSMGARIHFEDLLPNYWKDPEDELKPADDLTEKLLAWVKNQQ